MTIKSQQSDDTKVCLTETLNNFNNFPKKPGGILT